MDKIGLVTITYNSENVISAFLKNGFVANNDIKKINKPKSAFKFR